MLPYGAFSDPEAPPDLMVGPALGGKGEDFAFPAGRYIVTAEANGRIEGPSTSGNDLRLSRYHAAAVLKKLNRVVKGCAERHRGRYRALEGGESGQVGVTEVSVVTMDTR